MPGIYFLATKNAVILARFLCRIFFGWRGWLVARISGILARMPHLTFRQRRALMTWTVLFAVLFSAIAPAVSRVMASDNPDAWVEVCTAAGIRFIALSEIAGDSDSESAPQMGDSYCPYCLSQVVSASPPAPLTVPAASPLTNAVSVAFLDSPRSSFVWLGARSRAPPVAFAGLRG